MRVFSTLFAVYLLIVVNQPCKGMDEWGTRECFCKKDRCNGNFCFDVGTDDDGRPNEVICHPDASLCRCALEKGMNKLMECPGKSKSILYKY